MKLSLYLFLCLPVFGQEPSSKPLLPLPIKPEDQQQIVSAKPDAQELSFLSQIVEAQKQRIQWLATELARVKTCWTASVPEKQCGGVTPDGKSVMRLPESPEPAASAPSQ